MRYQIRGEGDAVEIVAVSTAPAPAPSPEETLPPGLPLKELAERYVTSFRSGEKEALVERIARTKPESVDDLRWLLNLYNRDYAGTGAAAASSLRLLSERDRRFSSFFLALLRDEEPFFQTFGILGSLQLRDENALPELRRIAKERFPAAEPRLRMNPLVANRWSVTFSALRALAEWGPPKTRALLERQSEDAPAVAELLARHYWRDSVERIVRWSESRDETDRARARRAWRAEPPVEDLRATWDTLFKVVDDRRKSYETRHQAAIKLGFASDDARIERVLEARGKARDAKERVLWTAALFASRSPKAVPALLEYARTHADPASRAGALIQLEEMLPAEEFAELLRWVAEHDPDEENRRLAKTKLAELDVERR